MLGFGRLSLPVTFTVLAVARRNLLDEFYCSHRCVFSCQSCREKVCRSVKRITDCTVAKPFAYLPPLRLPPCGGFYLWCAVLLAVTSLILIVPKNIQLIVACRYLCTKGCVVVNVSVVDHLRVISARFVLPVYENGSNVESTPGCAKTCRFWYVEPAAVFP